MKYSTTAAEREAAATTPNLSSEIISGSNHRPNLQPAALMASARPFRPAVGNGRIKVQILRRQNKQHEYIETRSTRSLRVYRNSLYSLYSLLTVRKLLLVRCPVSQRILIAVPLAEPPVIQDDQIDSNSSRLMSHLHHVVMIHVEVFRFPRIKQNLG
jgi:hypothetical protein